MFDESIDLLKFTVKGSMLGDLKHTTKMDPGSLEPQNGSLGYRLGIISGIVWHGHPLAKESISYTTMMKHGMMDYSVLYFQ